MSDLCSWPTEKVQRNQLTVKGLRSGSRVKAGALQSGSGVKIRKPGVRRPRSGSRLENNNQGCKSSVAVSRGGPDLVVESTQL